MERRRVRTPRRSLKCALDRFDFSDLFVGGALQQ
jgi:hypothetical protein